MPPRRRTTTVKRTAPRSRPLRRRVFSAAAAPARRRNPDSTSQRVLHAIRPSPTYHAADLANEIMMGHDGNYWQSLPDYRGVYHWKRIMY